MTPAPAGKKKDETQGGGAGGSAPSRVYVDGHVGTTGLRIRQWLGDRPDIELLTLPEAARKDPGARREMITSADVAVLCLPDDAAREAEAWAEGSGASNSGCYSLSFILLIRPLVEAGLIDAANALSIHALSGYSGGGRPMIEDWEDEGGALAGLPYEAPYAFDKVHKHIPEMLAYSGLEQPPHFVPAVGAFRCGMRLQVSLPTDRLAGGANAKALWEALDDRYRGEPFVRVSPIADPLEANEHSFDPRRCNDTNRIELRVLPHPSGHVLLMAILDNLGKGASGNAIQCLNLMLGCDETTGLPA